MYLAVLIQRNYLKCYGYEKVLNPAINDLVILEKDGIFLVYCVIADILMHTALLGLLGFFQGHMYILHCRKIR